MADIAQRSSSISRRLSTRFGIEDYFIKSKIDFSFLCHQRSRSYLFYRTFRVKYEEMVIQLKDINSGMPQGSVLRPVLYLLYTADLSVALGSITTTYADDSCTFAAHNNHIEAFLRLQKSLYHIQRWFKK